MAAYTLASSNEDSFPSWGILQWTTVTSATWRLGVGFAEDFFAYSTSASMNQSVGVLNRALIVFLPV